MNFDKIKAVAFDLDGTIYFGEELAEGALELISKLKEKGVRVFYFTNNSSKSRNQIFEKLTKLGIKTELASVYNSGYAASIYAEEKGYKKIYCCGAKGLTDQFVEKGLNVVDCKAVADAVFVGLDIDFNYKKLADVLGVIKRSNADFIACNVDKNYPIENEVLMPGCGSIVAAIETCAEQKIQFITGKPGFYMLDLLVKDHNLNKSEILVIGDSYESDIAMAKSYGCESVLISKKKIDEVFTIDKIQNLIPLI